MLTKVNHGGSAASARVNYTSNNKSAKVHNGDNNESTKVNHRGEKQDINTKLYEFGKKMYDDRDKTVNELATSSKHTAYHNVAVGAGYFTYGTVIGGVPGALVGGASLVRGFLNDRTGGGINKVEDKCAITNASLKIQEVALKNIGMKEVGKKVKETGTKVYNESKKTVKNAINNAIKIEKNIVRPAVKNLVREIIRADISISKGMRFKFR